MLDLGCSAYRHSHHLTGCWWLARGFFGVDWKLRAVEWGGCQQKATVALASCSIPQDCAAILDSSVGDSLLPVASSDEGGLAWLYGQIVVVAVEVVAHFWH